MTAVRNFASEEHEKAWLIVTASNTCKDELRRFKRKFQYIRNCLKSENSVSAGGGREGQRGDIRGKSQIHESVVGELECVGGDGAD